MRERQPENAKPIGHADAQMNGKGCWRNKPPVEAWFGNDSLATQQAMCKIPICGQRHGSIASPGRGRPRPCVTGGTDLRLLARRVQAGGGSNDCAIRALAAFHDMLKTGAHRWSHPVMSCPAANEGPIAKNGEKINELASDPET